MQPILPCCLPLQAKPLKQSLSYAQKEAIWSAFLRLHYTVALTACIVIRWSYIVSHDFIAPPWGQLKTFNRIVIINDNMLEGVVKWMVVILVLQ